MTFGIGHDQQLTILDQAEYDRVITKHPVCPSNNPRRRRMTMVITGRSPDDNGC